MFKRKAIYGILNLKAGDLPMVLPFMRYSFFMGVSVAIFYTASMSLFINSFDRTMLPKVYIASGIIVYALGFIVAKIQEKVYFSKLALGLIVFLIVSVVGLLVLHFLTGSKWVYFLLFLWNRVFVFVNGIAFWAIVSRIFNLQQAKRLISFITTGDVFSSIVSYLSIPLLLQFIDTNHLLYISVVVLVVCLVVMVSIGKKYEPELAIIARAPSKNERKTLRYFFETPYYTAIFLLALMPVVGLFYVEFMFAVESKNVFPNKETLTSFLGFFFGLCAIIELLIKTFLYGRVIEKYGLKLGLIILPLALTVFFVFAALYGSFYGNNYVFFAFVAMARFFMSTFRKSINDPSFQLLFQPIVPDERIELQSRIEGGPKAMGNIVAGVLLMVLTYFSFVDSVYLSYFFVLVLLGWLSISFKTQNLYRNVLKNLLMDVNKFKKAYQKHKISILSSPHFSKITEINQRYDFEKVIQLATSSRSEERLKSVYLLEKSGRYFAYKHLETLLQDPNTQVRQTAILAAGNIKKSELWPYLFNNLPSKYFAKSTSLALARIGEPVIGELERYFNRVENDKVTQLTIIGIFEKIISPASLRILRAKINHPDPQIRDRVYEALKNLNHRATSLERPHINAEIDERAALIVWLLAARRDISTQKDLIKLRKAISAENRQMVPKLFTLLDILNGEQGFELIKELYDNKGEDTKGFLQEVFNMSLSEDLRVKLVPIFEDTPLNEKLQKCQANYPQQSLTVEERILDIINKDFSQISKSLKAIAIQHLLRFPASDHKYILIACANSDAMIVAESALYVLYQLYPESFADFKETALLHEAERSVLLCEKIEKGLKKDELLVYKLSHIRSLELFENIPSDDLLTIANQRISLHLNEGETIFMHPYCSDGLPCVLVRRGEIELHESDGTHLLLSKDDYWYRSPVPPPHSLLHSIKALKATELILLDPYLVYNLIAQDGIEKNSILIHEGE